MKPYLIEKVLAAGGDREGGSETGKSRQLASALLDVPD